MKKDIEKIVERYYRGETTIAEERALKKIYQQGGLKEEPMLSYRGEEMEIPSQLTREIQTCIHRKSQFRLRQRILALSSVAALFGFIFFLRAFMPRQEAIPLSDNLKKERFEDALRTIGNVIDEKTPPVQRVLYEDNRLIIAVE